MEWEEHPNFQTFFKTFKYATRACASPSWKSGSRFPEVWRACLNVLSYMDKQSNNVLHPIDRNILPWRSSNTFEAPSSVEAWVHKQKCKFEVKRYKQELRNQFQHTKVLSSVKKATRVSILVWSSPAKCINVHSSSFPYNNSGSFWKREVPEKLH